MKNQLYYCLALFFVASSLVAQHKKLKIQRITDPCNNEVLLHKYKKNGLIEEEVSTLKGFKGGTVVNRTVYKYNGDGLVTRVSHICNDTLVSDEESEYIGNDLVHFRRTVKGKLMLDEAYTYQKRRALSIISTTPSGVLVKTIKYDDAKKMTETTTKSGNIITGIEKEYKNGNTVTAEHYTADGQNKPEVVKEYVYDFDGNLIDERTFIKDEETARVIYRFENGFPASKKEYAYGQLILDILYDKRGNPLREENFETGEVLMYDSSFNENRDLKQVLVLKGDATVQCTKKYENEYWD
ncbi:hypothetical protein ACLI09_15840 [Flavobacterium sp. RHBU_24]|uniref:hypothetical protein n=1 Tax=Flavobacterium sp. RHBU_24 TaxID=3391185 RepID=UPI0039850F19